MRFRLLRGDPSYYHAAGRTGGGPDSDSPIYQALSGERYWYGTISGRAVAREQSDGSLAKTNSINCITV